MINFYSFHVCIYIYKIYIYTHTHNSRRMRWAGHVAYMEDRRGAYGVLVGRHEIKRSIGRPRRRWEDKIKRHLQEV
jgi:hypothetical protein